MWNFGLPYKLKQLIDLVAQRSIRLPTTANSTGPSLTQRNRCLYARSRFPCPYRRRDSITKRPI